MNKYFVVIMLAASAIVLAGCPKQAANKAGSTFSSTSTSAGGEGAAGTEAPELGGDGRTPGEFFPPTGPPKQVILFYTGDTLSTIQPKRSLDSTEGGLCALAQAIGSYQSQIVDLNRLRVENEGGDAVSIRADLDAGMLGEHPFLLMDYGGWERPNDFAGQEYVGLYFRFFTDYHYCAVAGRMYELLSDERWQAYRALDYAPTLLATGSPTRPGALAAKQIEVRELHGQQWGIASPPFPALPDDTSPEEASAALKDAMGKAEAELAEAGCDFTIMLLGGAPTHIYREHAEESPFTVIIGSDRRTGVKEGYGNMPEHGALLLPEVDGSGRGAGVCHLYFEPGGADPVMYLFTLLDCEDDETQPWPYRRLVQEASVRHHELVEAGNPAAQ